MLFALACCRAAEVRVVDGDKCPRSRRRARVESAMGREGDPSRWPSTIAASLVGMSIVEARDPRRWRSRGEPSNAFFGDQLGEQRGVDLGSVTAGSTGAAQRRCLAAAQPAFRDARRRRQSWRAMQRMRSTWSKTFISWRQPERRCNLPSRVDSDDAPRTSGPISSSGRAFRLGFFPRGRSSASRGRLRLIIDRRGIVDSAPGLPRPCAGTAGSPGRPGADVATEGPGAAHSPFA
jgi:hypothetical protein